jgi:hypothetical protein
MAQRCIIQHACARAVGNYLYRWLRGWRMVDLGAAVEMGLGAIAGDTCTCAS